MSDPDGMGLDAPRQESYWDFSNHADNLPRFNPAPKITGTIRQHFADFEVTEKLSFEPEGQGEHLFLFIEKQSCNSQWVADELQKHFKLRSQDIGYAGKKDRHSLSRQWFSLHLPGKEKEVNQSQLDALNNRSFKVLKATRHNKKLRKGVIKYNHFKINVTNMSGQIDESIVSSLKIKGFPNYFGYQRFGFNGNNLVSAEQLLNNKIRVRSRNKKGLYISAARSYLFNLIVAQRIKHANWDQVLKGDCLSLSGTQSYFVCEEVNDDIKQRFELGDIHISSWMAGKIASESADEAQIMETRILEKHVSWVNSLIKEGVVSARRATRVIPSDLNVSKISDDNLTLEFCLPSGSFATSLLRELFIINDAAVSKSMNTQEENC